MSKKLVIVDVSALMRTYYRPIDSKYPMSVDLDIGTVNTSHLYGLFSLFKTYGKDCHYIFCYDSKNNILRNMRQDYKKGRNKVTSEYYVGYDTGREILTQAGFLVLIRDGYEADHLVIQAKEELVDYYDEVLVITNDKDLAVVIDEKTTWVSTRKKQGVITLDNYEERLGCPYNSIHLMKSLVGDPSDNLKGVKGFGPSRFKLFTENEELWDKDVYTHEQEIIKASDFLDDVEKAQALLDLQIIQPLKVDKLNLYFNEIDWEYVYKMLELFKMKSLYKYVK